MEGRRSKSASQETTYRNFFRLVFTLDVALDWLATTLSLRWMGVALPPKKKYGILAGIIILIALVVLFIVFERPILSAIAPVAAKFREIKYGSLIISACIIVSSIPPIPGGFAYGFPMGFLPVYPAALIGASLSFFICRLLCLGRATKMAEKQGNFYKLSLAIEEGGFWVIFLIRLSPFPFTYSNAFFAAVQSVSFTKFFIVTAITLPKILIHIFIGSRLHNLADEMDPTSRIVNYVSLGVGILFLFVATYIIYNKMNKVVEKAAAKRFLEKGDVESAFETDNEDDGSILYVGDETVVEEDISHHYYKNELNLA
ncbi:20342_t:CDS:2 [Entrophospora sp. SA101]|nr:20342_t:CDS:2 [Entrophospora sp. SA101]